MEKSATINKILKKYFSVLIISQVLLIIQFQGAATEISSMKERWNNFWYNYPAPTTEPPSVYSAPQRPHQAISDIYKLDSRIGDEVLIRSRELTQCLKENFRIMHRVTNLTEQMKFHQSDFKEDPFSILKFYPEPKPKRPHTSSETSEEQKPSHAVSNGPKIFHKFNGLIDLFEELMECIKNNVELKHKATYLEEELIKYPQVNFIKLDEYLKKRADNENEESST